MTFQAIAVSFGGSIVVWSSTATAGGEETIIERFQRRYASGHDDDEALRPTPGEEFESLPYLSLVGKSTTKS